MCRPMGVPPIGWSPEHRQGTRTDVRQLVGGQGEVGLVAPEPQTPIGDGEVGVFEVAEPLPREQLAAMLVRALALPPSR